MDTQKVLDFFTVSIPQEQESLRYRAGLFVTIVLFLVGLALLFLVPLLWMKKTALFAMLLIFLASSGLILGFLHQSGKFLIAVNVWLALVFSLELLGVCTSAYFNRVAGIWLLVIPPLVGLLVGARTSTLWSLIVAMGALGVFLMHLLGLTPSLFPHEGPTMLFWVVDFLSGVAVLWMLTQLYERRGKRALAVLQETNDALMESEQRLLNTLEHAPLMLWSFDLEGELQTAKGKGARELAQRARDLSRSKVNINHIEFAQGVKRALQGDQVMASVEHEGQHWRVHFGPMWGRAGEMRGAIGVAFDVTDRQRMEEVALLNKKLEATRDDAVQANRAKSTFLANMSHELRTPLNAIIGYSELLLEESQERGYLSLSDDLEKILASGHHLLSLIRDVLDISKIESGKMELYVERFSGQMLFDEVVDAARPLAQKNDNEFLVYCAPSIGVFETDQVKLRQILFNLLSNACKFTREGTIRFEFTPDEQRPESHVQFLVGDSGIGMDAEELKRVFQPFTQATQDISRRYGGTGLGLAISQRFCEMLKGELSVESHPGEGTTFTLKLPRSLENTHKPPRALESKRKPPGPSSTQTVQTFDLPKFSQLRGATVLAVMSQVKARELLVHWLSRVGYKVIFASNAEEALRLAKELTPKVILLEVELPGLGGEEILSMLKGDPQLCALPVVMMGELSEATNPRDTYGVLTKPLEKRGLLLMVERAMSSDA